MTTKYENVYINTYSTIAGPYEEKGPFGKLYDKTYDNLYFGEKTWEEAESKLIQESIDIALTKINKTRFDIDLHISLCDYCMPSLD